MSIYFGLFCSIGESEKLNLKTLSLFSFFNLLFITVENYEENLDLILLLFNLGLLISIVRTVLEIYLFLPLLLYDLFLLLVVTSVYWVIY